MLKISIIVAVLNNADYIETTIKSVLYQKHKNIEFIVIDGGSTDETLSILNRYGDKIDILVSEKDEGIYDALNKGIKLSCGDIIGILHSDDMYVSDTVLSKIVEIFLSRNADLVYGDLVYFSKTNPNKIVRYWRSGKFNKSKLRRGWMPPHPTVFARKEVYKQYGMFDVSFKISADYDFLLRILSENINVEYIPEVLYKMRIGGKSNRDIKCIIRKSREDLMALKNNNIGGFHTLILKNILKLPQFFMREGGTSASGPGLHS